MTSPRPPRLRDTRNLADLLRQDRINLRQLDPGLVGGKFPPAKPVRPRVDDDIEDDLADDTEQPEFWNTDRATATAAGQIVLNLTYEPIPGSLHIRWNGLDQPPTDWTLAGQQVTFAEPHVKVGHVLTAAYAYWPGDTPEPVITSPTEGSTTEDTTPTITGTAPAGWSVEVFIDDVSAGTTTAASDGTWSLTVGSALALGGHVAGATATSGEESGDAEPVDFSVTAPTPATAVLRGATKNDYAASGSGLSSLALPSGTVVGDFIAVCARDVSVTDSRLTNVGGGLWVGFATDLSNIAASAPGGFASFWSITCITLNTNATAWTSATLNTDSAMTNGDNIAVPSVSGVAVAVCGLIDNHHTVTGRTDLPVGYTVGIQSASGISHARVDFWTNATVSTSPATTSLFTGGDGGATAVVIGLIA